MLDTDVKYLGFYVFVSALVHVIPLQHFVIAWSTWQHPIKLCRFAL